MVYPKLNNVHEAIAYWQQALYNLDRKLAPMLRQRLEIEKRILFLRKERDFGRNPFRYALKKIIKPVKEVKNGINKTKTP